MALPAVKHPSMADFCGSSSTVLTPPYFNESDSLVIKHLPETFSEQDVRRFLTDAGAIEIKYFGISGRLKHLAIARFRNPQTAVLVMQKLHQIKLGKRRLVVEFADNNLTKHFASDENKTCSTAPDTKSSVTDASDTRETAEFIKDICQTNGIRSELEYEYPPPNPVALTNIMYILAECPPLYVQVLHLMNKMNLPIPFGPMRPAPKMFSSDSSRNADAENETDSSSDAECQVIAQNVAVKKPRTSSLPQRKRIRLSQFSDKTSDSTVASAAVTTVNAGTVFVAKALVSRHIHIEAPTTERLRTVALSTDGGNNNLVTEGFALMKPPDIPLQPVVSVPVICIEELDKLRVDSEELKGLAPFRNYSPGHPSSRLYVKNIAKSVEEEDLRFIFGRYVDWANPLDGESFGIRLMQEGRMKGQAFITFPNQFKAAQALKEVHGCRIKEKAVAVMFARSDR